MKKWITFMAFLCLTLVSVQAQDYVLTEILIKSHKELSDKLKARIPIESANLATHYLIEEAEKKYEGVTDTLSNRMASGLTDLHLIPEVARLTQDAVDAVKISEAAYSKAVDLMLIHPVVMDMIVQLNSGMADRITEIYRIIAMIVTNGLRVSLGTPEQRYMFLNVIHEKICWIRDNMLEFFNFMYYLEKMTLKTGTVNPKMDMEEVYRKTLRDIDKMYNNF